MHWIPSPDLLRSFTSNIAAARFVWQTALITLVCLGSGAGLRGQASQEKAAIDAFLGPSQMELQTLFQDERFPNIVVTRQGTLLATWGSHSLQVKRSEDGGHSWGPALTIAATGIQGGGTTVDETSGDILAFAESAHPPAVVTVYRSRDDGRTWQAQPQATIQPDTHGHAPSMHMNEHGITLRHDDYAGRLLRASRFYADKNEPAQWPLHYTNAIYSDDGGQTWHTSDPFPENGTGEAALVELADGTIYYNSRVHWQERPRNTRRRSALSKDGGQTWQDWRVVQVLPDGHQHRSYGCMGGLTRLPLPDRDILIFSNLDTPHATRERISVWASFDGGHSWPVKRQVDAGPAAYSSLIAGRPDSPTQGWIYLHYERGSRGGSAVARFNLSWILQGELTGDGSLPADLVVLTQDGR